MKLYWWFGIFFWTFHTFLYAQNLKFTQLDIKKGLSQNTVNCILQDTQGFIWLGTEDGLNKYDGNKFSIYRHLANNNQTSINHNTIHACMEDQSGTMWVATTSGLNQYDRDQDVFRPIKFNQTSQAISFYSVFEDSKGRFWLGSAGRGLFLFDKKTQTFQSFHPDLAKLSIWTMKEDAQGNIWLGTLEQGLKILNSQQKIESTNIPATIIRSLALDKQGNIWVGSEDQGLFKIQTQQKNITQYAHNQDQTGTNSKSIWSLRLDENTLWIGTDGGGLNKLDISSGNFTYHLQESCRLNSLSSNVIRYLFQGRQGDLWLGTYAGGVNRMAKNTNKVLHYIHNPNLPNSLSYNSILSFAEEADGSIWVGTDGGGLNLLKNNQFKVFKGDKNQAGQLNDQVVLSLYKSQKDNKLWIGTYTGGLNVYENGQFKAYTHQANNPNSLLENSIWAIVEDQANNLWLATNNGLSVLDKTRQNFRNFPIQANNPQALPSATVRSLYCDSKGNIWVGTFGGLSMYNPQNQQFTHYQNNPKNPKSLTNNAVICILEDSQKRIWAGTYGGGLNLFEPKTQTFTHFTENEGLINNVVYGILEDAQKNLWISTNKGLVKLLVDKKIFKNYNSGKGLQGDIYNSRACLKLKDGKMLFGGINGFNLFAPEDIIENPFAPPVVMTDFLLFNKSIKIGDKNKKLLKHINQTQELNLSYQDAVISFEFSALNFDEPEKNQYAYIMEGFEKEWNYIGNKNFVSYTNLPAGQTYIFRVKAANNDGIWNEKGIQIKIYVNPPWWETLWFRTLVITLLVIGIYSIYAYRINAIRRQKELLEQQVTQRTAELQAANQNLYKQKEEILQQSEELSQQAEELATQRDFIDAKNQLLEKRDLQIKSSINAALTIQKAILPFKGKVERLFKEHFIIYMPKDVVSGDFYWVQKVSENTIVLTVVDCTGHGIPGAFMTLISSTLLDKIVRFGKIIEPAQILRELDIEIKQALKQKHVRNNYGMDMVVVKIETLSDNQKKLTFAGAKNGLYIIENQQIRVLRGSRYSIGGDGGYEVNKVFDTQEIDLAEESLIYIGSDGLEDQNDENRRRFGSQQLQKFLLEIAHLPLREQQTLLEAKLETYMQNTEQRDDILFMGIKI